MTGGALDGVRVLDLATNLPGQLAGVLLADLGAAVVKIERPGSGDMSRSLRPGSFEAVNRNKRSVTVDFSRPAGARIVAGLAERSDVLLECFKPGGLARRGLGYEDLRERAPRLVYCSISSYGQTGPLRDSPAHDLNIQARAGMLSLGLADGARPAVGISVVDVTAGLCAALSVLAALAARERTGRGQYVDQGMYDAAFALTQLRVTELLVDPNLAEADLRPAAAMSVHRCRDGGYVSIAAVENPFWERTVALPGFGRLSRPEWRDLGRRQQDWRAIDALLDEAFAGRDTEEVLAALVAAGVPVARVNGFRQAVEEAQTRARGLVAEVAGQPAVRFPSLLSDTPAVLATPAPRLGEHTDEVLGALGLSAADVAALRRDGVL